MEALPGSSASCELEAPPSTQPPDSNEGLELSVLRIPAPNESAHESATESEEVPASGENAQNTQPGNQPAADAPRQPEPSPWQRFLKSLRKYKKLSIWVSLLSILGFLVNATLVEPAFRGQALSEQSTRLAAWEAAKDFQALCQAVQAANQTMPNCQEALDMVLPPPPLFDTFVSVKSIVKRKSSRIRKEVSHRTVDLSLMISKIGSVVSDIAIGVYATILEIITDFWVIITTMNARISWMAWAQRIIGLVFITTPYLLSLMYGQPTPPFERAVISILYLITIPCWGLVFLYNQTVTTIIAIVFVIVSASRGKCDGFAYSVAIALFAIVAYNRREPPLFLNIAVFMVFCAACTHCFQQRILVGVLISFIAGILCHCGNFEY